MEATCKNWNFKINDEKKKKRKKKKKEIKDQK